MVVEGMNADAERDGLTTAQIRTDVELRLRKAGIPLRSVGEEKRQRGEPYLYVNIATLRSSNAPVYAVNVSVELKQDVRLERNPSISCPGAATWQTTGTVGVFHPSRLADSRKIVQDMTDEFANAYLSENPFPAASKSARP